MMETAGEGPMAKFKLEMLVFETSFLLIFSRDGHVILACGKEIASNFGSLVQMECG